MLPAIAEAARDHMEGRRRLRDRLARPAAELLAHVLGHEPLPRDDIEGFGDILPDLRELRAAAAHRESPAASPCVARSCEPRRSPPPAWRRPRRDPPRGPQAATPSDR